MLNRDLLLLLINKHSQAEGCRALACIFSGPSPVVFRTARVSKRHEHHNEIAGTAYYFLIPTCSPFAPRVDRALNVLAIEQNHI